MTDLTVATINVRNNANRWLQRRQLLVAQLVDAAPDLVSLQEIGFPINQGPWLCSQINWRISGSAKRPYRLIQRRKRHLFNGYFEGIGVLSKLPVVYHDQIALGYGGRLAVRANVQVTPQKIVDFVAVHLHHVSYEREARTEQVMKLVGWLNSHRRIPYQIIAGDFNETPDGPAISYMKQSYRSAYAERHGHEPLATFPTALPGLSNRWAGCLDYTFLSPAVGPVRSAALFCDRPDAEDDTLYPSDHVGLLTTLQI